MSAWKRGFLEIVSEILDSLIEEPLIKTHITFRCNLDSRAVTKYILLMENIGLIEKSKSTKSHFAITQKGILYRKRFNTFVDMIQPENNNTFQDTEKKQLLTVLRPSN